MKERIARRETDMSSHVCDYLNDDLTYWFIQCKVILSQVFYTA